MSICLSVCFFLFVSRGPHFLFPSILAGTREKESELTEAGEG